MSLYPDDQKSLGMLLLFILLIFKAPFHSFLKNSFINCDDVIPFNPDYPNKHFIFTVYKQLMRLTDHMEGILVPEKGNSREENDCRPGLSKGRGIYSLRAGHLLLNASC